MGSKSTTLLAYRLKRQQAKRTIYKIRDLLENGIKYGIRDVLQKCLHSAKRQKLLTTNKATSSLKTNKSPGPDGYTAEWYRVLREGRHPPPVEKRYNSYTQAGGRWAGLF